MRDAETVTLTIARVGVRGDGIGAWQGEPIYVPFTAPGDVVQAKLGTRRGEGRTAELLAVIAPGARATPVCAHFGTCGGCALQHLDDSAYTGAKTEWLETALAQHGVKPDAIATLQKLPAGTRRRARFQLEPQRIGFHARASHRIIDLKECAVLHPTLFALVAPLRKLTAVLLSSGKKGIASATLTDNGVDLVLDLPAAPGLRQLEALARFAEAADLARLAWRDGDVATPIAIRRKPQVTLSGVVVELPEDGFLQPSVAAEAALTTAVVELSGKAASIADLYAGIGTFSFALARHAKIHAVEFSSSAVAALARAAARAGLAPMVATEKRDLAAAPLTQDELARFDAVVFDPPYAGAAAQCRALAASGVKRVVAVSCNPASFARDARILVDGGYRLVSVRPFDAFIWSANLELVASFERP
jgi:23S rRNA (uracil1939-C5)-methyltransferase